jgi:hypothetical protein
VKEERDAYMDLQNEFSSQIKQSSEAISAATKEKQQLQTNLHAERRTSLQNLGQVS